MSQQGYIVETGRTTAGVAVVDGSGYRFFASHPMFGRLEGVRFPSVAAAEDACRREETRLERPRGGGTRRTDAWISWSRNADAA